MSKWENTYFHPVPNGVKLTNKMRTKLYSSAQTKTNAVGQKWDKYENTYFQPLGKGRKLSGDMRFKLFSGGHGAVKPLASKWQDWEDKMFGHTQAAVAARRMPMVCVVMLLCCFVSLCASLWKFKDGSTRCVSRA